MEDLTAFQRDLLVATAGLEDPHGIAVKEELEAYYGDEVRHGRLYPNLDTLVNEGLLDKGQKDRRTNEYTLTETGQEVIDARLDWQEQHLSDARVPDALVQAEQDD